MGRKQRCLRFHKKRVYPSKPKEQEASLAISLSTTNVTTQTHTSSFSCVTSQTHTSGSSSAKNVCIHLSMGLCPCTHASAGSSPKNVCSHLSKGVSCSSSTKKRKLGQKDSIFVRKRTCNDVDIRWGYSLDLMFYDDPWKIKKVLQESDLGNMSRLLLAKNLAENLVLPVLDADAQRDDEIDRGIQVGIWDVDTNSMHSLVFKRWGSSRSYVFIGKWIQDFVKRRNLKTGDEIGFHWDPYKNHFDFSVLQVN